MHKQDRRAMTITGEDVTQPGHRAKPESPPTAHDATRGSLLGKTTRFAASGPAKMTSLVRPFELKFDLLFVPLSFVLYVELSTSGHVDPLSGHLDLESL